MAPRRTMTDPNESRASGPTDRYIGQAIRRRRLEIGMSQERLAELLGVTFQQVQKYEKGVNRVAASRLVDIGQALDAAPTFFLPASGREVDAVDPVSTVLAEHNGLRLARAFVAASTRQRLALADLAEVMVERPTRSKT